MKRSETTSLLVFSISSGFVGGILGLTLSDKHSTLLAGFGLTTGILFGSGIWWWKK